MAKKSEFKIGDWVKVHVVAVFVPHNGRRTLGYKTLREPLVGQIVGAVQRRLGKYKGACYDVWDECSQAFLIPDRTVTVYQVRRGMLNKPVEVLPENLQPVEQLKELPWKWTNPAKWTDTARRALSEESKGWPRDEKGRYVKEVLHETQ